MTALSGRIAVVGLSAGVHAAVLFTSLGHPAAAGTARSDAVEIEITPAPSVVDDFVETPAPRAPSGTPMWPTHTHPYPVPASHDLVPHDPSLVHTFALPMSAPAPSLPPPDTLHSEDDATPRFTIALGPPGTTGGTGAPSAASPPSTGSPAGSVAEVLLPESSVDVRARLVRGVNPAYPEAARADGVEGSVGLELIVDDGGVVENARVVRPVGHGLDEAALVAARQFRFAPAMKSGHAVHVRMAWSVDFRFRQ